MQSISPNWSGRIPLPPAHYSDGKSWNMDNLEQDLKDYLAQKQLQLDSLNKKTGLSWLLYSGHRLVLTERMDEVRDILTQIKAIKNSAEPVRDSGVLLHLLQWCWNNHSSELTQNSKGELGKIVAKHLLRAHTTYTDANKSGVKMRHINPAVLAPAIAAVELPESPVTRAVAPCA